MIFYFQFLQFHCKYAFNSSFFENLEKKYSVIHVSMCVSNNINQGFNLSSNLSICFRQFQTLLFFFITFNSDNGQIVME